LKADAAMMEIRMKTLSRALLSALLLTGVAGGAIVAQPAVAQKKKETGPKLSPEALKAAQAAQTAIAASDFATAQTALTQLDTAAKTDQDRYFAAALRLEMEQGRIRVARQANPNAPVDQSRLAAPLDALLASPLTEPSRKGQMAYIRGQLAYEAKQYPQTLQYWNQAKQFGYNDPNFGLNMMRVKEQSGDTQGALADLNAELQRTTAAGQKPTEELYRYGLARGIKQPGQALPWMQRLLVAYPTAKNWRDVAVLYGLQQGSVATLDTPQKIDLFRLMHHTRSLADQYDYGEYAQKTFDRGLPEEAKRILNEGIAAGKIPAANREYKAMQTEIGKAIANESPLGPLETKAKSAGDGKLAAQTAEAYLSQNNNAKAAELYRIALQKGNVNADEVNTRLGIALARQGDKEGARAAFTAVKGTPRADLAQLWITSLDAPVTA
jgi:hypothetical protein